MSGANPAFKNVDRAAYELPWAMKNLPDGRMQLANLKPDELLVARAAQLHAFNALSTVLTGIEAIGHLIFSASTNDGGEVEPHHLAGLGSLIAHLGVEAQYLSETESELRVAINAADMASAKPKKGAAAS